MTMTGFILLVTRKLTAMVLFMAMLFPNAIQVPQAPPGDSPVQQQAAEGENEGALGLPGNLRVEDGFFNDTLFVGDSVTRKLELYVRNQRKTNPGLLGDARFF